MSPYHKGRTCTNFGKNGAYIKFIKTFTLEILINAYIYIFYLEFLINIKSLSENMIKILKMNFKSHTDR